LHISEGILTTPILVAGGAVTAVGTAIGLWKLDYDKVPEAGVMSAAFFVASLIHIPLGPASAHLLLIGLSGVLLGWSAFPAMLAAFFLQAVLFGFGGLTTLGVNTANFAVPAVLCYYLFNRVLRRARSRRTAFAVGAAAGAMGPMIAFAMMSAELFAAGEEFLGAIYAILIAHVAVLVIEGLVTGSAAAAIRRLEPELLGASA
jgi:cobalt/nickel transport system permease protein